MIDHSNLSHKAVVKRVMQRYIEMMTPSEEVPISGYWRAQPYNYSRSGICEVYTGDNGGMGGEYVDNNPGEPLCGYGSAEDGSDGLSFIEWQNSDFPYIQGTSSIYGNEPSVDIDIVRDANGATIRNMRTEHTTEYEVVAPDRIIVHDTIREVGGCTLQADYVLELVTQDETVCNIMELPPDLISTPVPVTTPPPAEPQPVRVGQPIFTDEEECTEANRLPALDTVTIASSADGAVVLNYGSGATAGSLTLYGGDGYYEYDSGMAVAMRQSVSLVLFDDGTGGSIFWSNNRKDGNICSASYDVTLPNSENSASATPAPGDDSTTTSGSSADETATNGASAGSLAGHYTVTWSGYPAMECPAALEAALPNFTDALVSEDGGSYLLEAGDASYQLDKSTSGQYSYIVFNSDNSGMVVVISAGDAGHLIGSYTLFAADGSMCAKMLDYAPA